MSVKEIVFSGNSLRDLQAFPDLARREAGQQLRRVQFGEDPTDWKPMSSIGQGVREIRIRKAGAWRVIYVANIGGVVHVLHAFQKKSQSTAKPDLELATHRYRAALNEYGDSK
jgi:phage-related protein